MNLVYADHALRSEAKERVGIILSNVRFSTEPITQT